MATKLSLINNALILIGDVPLTSLNSGTRAQVVATSLYDNIVQSELSKFRWGFARTQTEMLGTLVLFARLSCLTLRA